MHLIICDIDGTVSDFTERSKLLGTSDGSKGDQKNWDLFISSEETYKDPVCKGAKEGLDAFIRVGAEIVFLTGRNAGLLDVTVKWFKDNLGMNLVLNKNLYMRPKDNLDSASVFKKKALYQIFSDYGVFESDTVTAIDDDPYTLTYVYPNMGFNIILKAPECWSVLFPVTENLPEEKAWRK